MMTESNSEFMLENLKSGKPRNQFLALSNIALEKKPKYIDVEGMTELKIVDGALNSAITPKLIEAVVNCLRSENSDVQVEATKALGRIGNPAIVSILNLLHDQSISLDFRVAIVVNLLSRMGLKDTEAKILLDALKKPDLQTLNDQLKVFLNGAISIS